MEKSNWIQVDEQTYLNKNYLRIVYVEKNNKGIYEILGIEESGEEWLLSWNYDDFENKAEAIVQKSDLIDLEERKQKLIGYIKNRIKDNPNQKNFVLKGEFSDQEN